MLDSLTNKKLILASKSPRRQALLSGLDIDFEVRTKEVEETYPSTLTPEEVPVFLAEKKAAAFKPELNENELILTADTIVIQGNQILEKPQSQEDAERMITQLQGAEHHVVTGVSIQSTTKQLSFSDQTKVAFMPLTSAEIDYYIDKYQPFDKAGSYGVQEWIGYIGISRLEGSYYNVVGLPVHKVYQELKNF